MSSSSSISTSNPISAYSNPTTSTYHEPLPLQPHPIGSLLPKDRYSQNANPPKLFEELRIRGMTFPNRAWLAPMRMSKFDTRPGLNEIDSSQDGKASDHHFIHYGSIALRGWGGIMVEGSAVVPEGRISPEDMGIWSDDQIPGLKRIVDYVHAHHGKIGIQLSHAGRKASQVAPWIKEQARDEGWKGGRIASDAAGGWGDKVVAPSELSFRDGDFANPVAADLEYIENLKKAFIHAVERCKIIGFDFIDIHGAHGYLLHQFTSPLTNRRTDQYGGSYANRTRLPLEITKLIRKAWDKPLLYRISASDWLDNIEGPEKSHPGEEEEYNWWGLEQTTIFAEQLRDAGVDLLDVSAGGNDKRQRIKGEPKYQVPFASHIKRNVPGLLVGTVGNLTGAEECNSIIEDGEADVVFLAREALRNIEFPLHAAQTLGVAIAPAVQYAEAWTGMTAKKS